MSNISKKAVHVVDGVNVTIENGKVLVVGSKGNLEANIPQGIAVTLEDGKVKVVNSSSAKDFEKYAGLIRALVANMVEGVSKGFEKKLELTGVGYRAKVEGVDLVLNVGYSIPVKVKPVDGVTISVDENIITVSGANKQFVGDIASNIRKVRPPDPYKGKGIKYVGEKIRRKVGKAAKAVGAK